MGCFPCGQLNAEVKALNDCYPVSKEIVKSGPEFMPLSQDLSKLTYMAKNKPSSLSKIGDELEKRVAKEAKGSTGGYPKSRAGLLISLVILNKLLTECKRDISLFARQTMHMITAALDVKVYQQNKVDLEVAARASNCFVAYAKGTDGGGIGVDDSLTHGYLAVLNKFSQLALHTLGAEKPDEEEQSRARLIGLRGLSGASSADGVLSMSEFPRQIKVIIPALLNLLREASVTELKALMLWKRSGGRDRNVYLFDQQRPAHTRAQSLTEHVPGEKGPDADDVTSAAFQCLYDLVSECHQTQASHILDVVFAFLDQQGWQDIERCCWLAESLASAMLLQSRFVVPTRLVELLVNLPDDNPPTAKHSTVLAMVTTVLSSNVSLVGLAVTDILSSLINVIERRVGVSPSDSLIPALVACVSSLGTHIYYADQINDIVEETALQMATIQTSNPARQEILRVLIHCITGVMTAADAGDAEEAEARELARTPTNASSPAKDARDKGKGPALESPAVELRRDFGRRNPIAPEVWQETLPLLCEASYPVRAAYARALIFYLQSELPRDKRPRPDEPNILRFSHALHAALYTLAMSSRLGVGEPLPSGPPTPGNGTPPREVTFEPLQDERERRPTVSTANGNGRSTPPSGTATPKRPLRGGRRVSLPLNRLHSVADNSPFDAVATPFDYAAILAILDEAHAATPVASLLAGTPMLLALDADAGTELQRRPGAPSGAWIGERRRACRETLALAWRRIARRWGVAPLVEMADSAINSLPEPFVVPEMRGFMNGLYTGNEVPAPEEPCGFVRDEGAGESYASTQPLLPPAEVVAALSAAQGVQSGTHADAASLAAALGAAWSVEGAIRNSVERFASPPAPQEERTALMAIPNASYQSFGRPISRSVDVNDLRDALAGEPSRDTGSATGSVVSSAIDIPRQRQDAKEILKEIFKDKRLGASAPV